MGANFPSNDSSQQTTQTTDSNNHYATDSKATPSEASKTDAKTALAEKTNFSEYDNAKTVTVNTGVFKDLQVSLNNGAIISASLKDYTVSLDDKSAMPLLTSKDKSQYIAKSNIVVDKKPLTIEFKNDGLKKEGNKQVLTLSGSANGLNIVRTYTFDDAKYNISISQSITNTGATPAKCNHRQLICS